MRKLISISTLIIICIVALVIIPCIPDASGLDGNVQTIDTQYILPLSFRFYQSVEPIHNITKITFSHTAPQQYDEKWTANLAKTDALVGYRCGNEIYIVGEHIYANSYASCMFARFTPYGGELWTSLESIEGLELLDMSYCTDMSYIFYEQPWSEIHGISDWDVSNVVDMTNAFSGCVNITTLDIGQWDTSSVQAFQGMFSGHNWSGDMKLTSLPIERWNTASAIDMSHMFYGCAQLVEAPVTYWNVSNVKSFSHFFADCEKLEQPNIHNWDTSSVESFDAFFNDCRSLTTLDVSGLDTGNCKQFSQMFEACTQLKEIIGLETWDVSNANESAFQQMFHACTSLEYIDLSAWNAQPDDTARMFANCSSLKQANLSGIDMSRCEWIQEMFWNCTALETVVWNIPYNLQSIMGYDSMMKGCSNNVCHIYKTRVSPAPTPHVQNHYALSFFS